MKECNEAYFRQLYKSHLKKYFFFRLLRKLVLPIDLFLYYMRSNNAGVVSTARFVYRHYLKKHFFFRLLKDSIRPVFRKLNSFYLRTVRSFRAKKFSLLPVSVSKSEFTCNSKILRASESIVVSGPIFFGEVPQELKCEERVQLDFPELELIHFCDSSVIGGTNFILSGNFVIHPDFFVPSRDVPPIETFSVASINPNKNEISLNLSKSKKNVWEAVSLLGQCTGNYAHWLTETLPKLLLLDRCSEYKSLPLLVDGWIHPVFFETIALLNKNNRKIIKVERWEQVSLVNVIDITPAAYVPPEYREFVKNGEVFKTGGDVFPFSRYALNLLRSEAYRAAELGVKKKKFPKMLYLRRSRHSCGNARSLLNINSVEKVIEQYGFETVETASLSFSEQVMLFREAEIIISPVGAALANTIFTKAGCKIIALSPYYKNANYYYFSNLMGVLEHDLYYVLGPQVEMNGHPFHKDYNINIDALNEALETLCA